MSPFNYLIVSEKSFYKGSLPVQSNGTMALNSSILPVIKSLYINKNIFKLWWLEI